MHSPETLSVALDRASCLYSLWLQGSLADCELVAADGAVIPAHRVVLAAASGFFRALFDGAWHHGHPQPARPLSPAANSSCSSGGLPRWTLSGVDGAALTLLLHAIYSRRLPVTAEGAAEEVPALLAASNYLEVLPVKEACCAYLRSQLSLETVADTLALAFAHDCSDLLADAARFFEGHCSQLLKAEGAAASLAVLPPCLLRDLLSSDGLNIACELEVARAALLWAAADPRQRGPLLRELLPAVRMPPGALAEEAAAAGLLGGGLAAWLRPGSPAGATPSPSQQQQQQQHCQPPPPSQQQLEDQLPPPPATPQQGGGGVGELGHAFLHACQALQHSSGPSAAALGCSAGAEAAVVAYRPRLSCPTGLVMAGGLDDGWRPLRTVELYDPQRDAWTSGPAMPAPCHFASAAMLGGQTFVVEGAAHAPHVLAFDRQARTWRQCTGLATPRVNMAVAALEGLLYVLGGRAGIGKGAAVLREVEVFEASSNAWRPAAPMAQPRCALAAAALGGRLYAVGGQSGRSCHATVECWEPGAGRWVELGGAMQQPRKYLGLAAAGGRLIAVGGLTGARMRLQAAEAFDPREGRWLPLPPASTARSSAGVAALHDCVYVAGGNNFAGVEAYVPAAGRWRACAPISHGRSGLSVAPF